MIKVFDYLCGNCKTTQELWLKTDEVPTCGNPDCGSTDMKKLPAVSKYQRVLSPYEKYL